MMGKTFRRGDSVAIGQNEGEICRVNKRTLVIVCEGLRIRVPQSGATLLQKARDRRRLDQGGRAL